MNLYNSLPEAYLALAFDTSNYTTSAAWFDGKGGNNSSLPLIVGKGELGLRQNEALFKHVKQLPEALKNLDGSSILNFSRIKAVGVSSKPREAEESYMPCFLAGVSQAETIARLAGVRCYKFSHQQGHIAAAAWSSGRMELLDSPFLAWHLSGGTTELLYVRPAGTSVTCKKIGGTTDISAGQLVDRTGKMLGLSFPAGRELDSLAQKADKKDFYSVKVTGNEFSLSGMENKVAELDTEAADIAYFTLATIADAVRRATSEARKQYGPLHILYSGGVASSVILRNTLEGFFAEPEYSTDNALGTAILTYRAVTG